MSWSLGEARALGVKAARGAGMPWGLAEEAGFAVYRLQQHGLPGVRALAEYLTLRSSANFSSLPAWENTSKSSSINPFCPLEKGTAMQDSDNLTSGEIGHVYYPILLVPFLPAGGVLQYSNNELHISSNSITYNADDERLLWRQAGCSWGKSETFARKTVTKTRIRDSDYAYIDWLTEFAANTYAPATEQSRLAGAGAGLNDND